MQVDAGSRSGLSHMPIENANHLTYATCTYNVRTITPIDD